MGKKRKRSSTSLNASNSAVATDDFRSLQDGIIQHLQSLKGSGGLVVGCNEVLRGIERNLLSVVILISGKATPAIYHALHLMCRDRDVLFLQLQDINHIIEDSKIPSSTAYGIKTNIVTNVPKFSKLSKKINIAKGLQKSRMQKKVKTSCREKEDLALQNKDDDSLENDNDTGGPKSFIHAKHGASKVKTVCPMRTQCHKTLHNQPTKVNFIQEGENFVSLSEELDCDFPDYGSDTSKIAICIEKVQS